jgi:hypothetical protein
MNIIEWYFQIVLKLRMGQESYNELSTRQKQHRIVEADDKIDKELTAI